MTTGPESNPQDFSAQREAQCQRAQELGVEIMSVHHFKAYFGGFPPDSAIITPKSLRDAVALGEIPTESTPIGQARETLKEIVGEYRPVPRPTSLFNSQNAVENTMSISNLFNGPGRWV